MSRKINEDNEKKMAKRISLSKRQKYKDKNIIQQC